MIGAKVNLSRETEKQIIIQELNALGIYENMKGESLNQLSYFTLLFLLEIEQVNRK